MEFEERVDTKFDTKFHDLGVSLNSNAIARREVDTDVREFFNIAAGRPSTSTTLGRMPCSICVAICRAILSILIDSSMSCKQSI